MLSQSVSISSGLAVIGLRAYLPVGGPLCGAAHNKLLEIVLLQYTVNNYVTVTTYVPKVYPNPTID